MVFITFWQLIFTGLLGAGLFSVIPSIPGYVGIYQQDVLSTAVASTKSGE